MWEDEVKEFDVGGHFHMNLPGTGMKYFQGLVDEFLRMVANKEVQESDSAILFGWVSSYDATGLLN